MNKTLILLVFFLLTLSSISQNSSSEGHIVRCLTDENIQLIKNTYPEFKKIKHLQSKIASQNALRVQGNLEVIRIPVVVHVIHSGEAIGVGPNISDAQVLSQIRVLNEDFRRIQGTRGFNTHPDGADTEIEFYLAKEDPQCNPTTGIDRRNMSSFANSWSGPGGNTDNILKPETIWDPDRYLNIWTVKFSDPNNLGFAQFPGGPEQTDGVVITYDAFGSIETPSVVLNPPYNLGRTTTHEVGHYFGLYHTFNGLSCNGDGDFADDTPPTNRENYGCPTVIPDSCPGDSEDDMIENYMDYSDDRCMNVFTNDQAAIMRSYLNDPAFRLSLKNSNISDTPPSEIDEDTSLTILDLNEDECDGTITPKIKLANYGTQTLNSATILYRVNNGGLGEYNWSGTLTQGQSVNIDLPEQASPVGSNFFFIQLDNQSADSRTCNNDDTASFTGSPAYTETNSIILNLLTDNFSEETTWEFKDETGTVLYSGGPYNGSSNDNTLFTESFDVQQGRCYTFTIYDTENDGICCNYGEGSYELTTDDGVVIYEGGEFGSQESTVISTTPREEIEDPNAKIRIYPNPTITHFFIDLVDEDKLPKNYQIFDIAGQLIIEVDVKSDQDLTVNTRYLTKGVYFLRLNGVGNTVIPFIKD